MKRGTALTNFTSFMLTLSTWPILLIMYSMIDSCGYHFASVFAIKEGQEPEEDFLTIESSE